MKNDALAFEAQELNSISEIAEGDVSFHFSTRVVKKLN